ncbi:MAG TPA: RagB/SusD family nutrient uptake outer membrane protein [Gemmatimonadaceae bacterium]|nr:RagB/SusD family nutrient uptake outer membrane protein [Gemmatimonadaceae bacterium]
MRNRTLMPALLLAIVAGCNGPLDVKSKNTIPTETAISDSTSARAALAGMYHGLQSLSSYGSDIPEVGDLSSDNAEFSGTSTSYGEIDDNQISAFNSAVFDIWSQAYANINSANEILDKLGTLTNLDPATRDELQGEAYFVRALMYHDLVKYFGDVPIRLHPTTDPNAGSTVTRSPVSAVYDQILLDLDSAASRISDSSSTTTASGGAVRALRARVLFYRGDYAGAEAEAHAVETDFGYGLAPNYSDLFSTTGNATPEDIFKVIATVHADQQSFLSYDYFAKAVGGTYLLRPTNDIMATYQPGFDYDEDDPSDWHPTDLRGEWNIQFAGSRKYGAKYRSVTGTENFPVLRLGEIILIRAEALARSNQLPQAVSELNLIQARANATPFVLGAHTQQEVIDAIVAERRLELAFEGDRWPDLVRLGIAADVMGIDASQTLYPIPQAEIDVTPGLTQNPGY